MIQDVLDAQNLSPKPPYFFCPDGIGAPKMLRLMLSNSCERSPSPTGKNCSESGMLFSDSQKEKEPGVEGGVKGKQTREVLIIVYLLDLSSF